MAPEEDDRLTPPGAAASADGDAATPGATTVAPASDLRAKDLLTLPREEIEAAIDPATMAELASWFLRPSRVVVDETISSAPQADLDAFERLALAIGQTDSEDERQERAATRNRALAAVQPVMMEIFDRHEQRAATILPTRPEPRQWIDESIVPRSVRALVPTGEDTPAIGEPRLIVRSPDIDALLDEDNAPQAVLRDLNRPVEDYEVRMVPAFPPPAPSDDAPFTIRDALRWRPEPLPDREPFPDHRATWRPLHEAAWPELVKAAAAQRAKDIAEAAASDPDGRFFWR